MELNRRPLLEAYLFCTYNKLTKALCTCPRRSSHPMCFFPSSLTWKKSITVRSRKSTEIIFAVITQLWQPLTFYNSFWTWLFLNATSQSPWVTFLPEVTSGLLRLPSFIRSSFLSSIQVLHTLQNQTTPLSSRWPFLSGTVEGLLWSIIYDFNLVPISTQFEVTLLLDVQNRAPFGSGLWELTDDRMQHAGGCCHMVKGNAW